ncbi:hypothetical protein VLL09_04710 [Dehalococcoides mccartyi]|uniref:Uncharacterized protein n=1 Tax=Dehalococcoides mccartyi TaxID=61435 RepID=A0AB38Z7Y3_9CHLR|nr:hypothetical protein [Dehalococcoides mccartyi]WRO06694.1 hypothetical protein VLL09_04710 [Dehalococcoides mccartyi]
MRKLRKTILTEEQRQAGLELYDDEDFVYLYDRTREGRVVFSSLGVTIESLVAEAGRMMEEHNVEIKGPDNSR